MPSTGTTLITKSLCQSELGYDGQLSRSVVLDTADISNRYAISALLGKNFNHHPSSITLTNLVDLTAQEYWRVESALLHTEQHSYTTYTTQAQVYCDDKNSPMALVLAVYTDTAEQTE